MYNNIYGAVPASFTAYDRICYLYVGEGLGDPGNGICRLP